MTAAESWLGRRQIGLYLVAILTAGVVGLTVPGARHLETAIEPVLGLLLFATF
ncbi:TPA: arsenic resistance protein, partial [Enterococcus faecium]|nr:arsenic resistance protein [Enterococcus faecium]